MGLILDLLLFTKRTIGLFIIFLQGYPQRMRLLRRLYNFILSVSYIHDSNRNCKLDLWPQKKTHFKAENLI